jgi:hypothetical protein
MTRVECLWVERNTLSSTAQEHNSPNQRLLATLTEDGSAMDQLDRYRELVCRLIEEYASYKPANGDIRTKAVLNRERDHYEVMQVGWEGDRRVHGSIIHIDIRDGKVWLEYNSTAVPFVAAFL